MCRTYNTIGSLATLKSHLEHSNIHDFKSLREVMDFQNSFASLKAQLIAHHSNLIEQEKGMLNMELPQLKAEIEIQRQQSEKRLKEEIDKLKEELSISKGCEPTNIFQTIAKILKQRSYKKKIKAKEDRFGVEVGRSISSLIDNYQYKSDRFDFIYSNVDEAVRQSAQYPLSELERKKTTIDGLNSFIYGALGEQKVVKALGSLSEDYFLINDFAVSFSPAIYNKQENDYIKSVQIDHILVGPSGVFLIETKNWSEKSLENLSLRSPVQQIRRASFVLFKLLNNEMSQYHLQLNSHHWGDKKIAIRNLIALTNTKPKEEFQYVKILTVDELVGYINYFKPSFSNAETQRITDFLLDLNSRKTIITN